MPGSSATRGRSTGGRGERSTLPCRTLPREDGPSLSLGREEALPPSLCEASLPGVVAREEGWQVVSQQGYSSLVE